MQVAKATATKGVTFLGVDERDTKTDALSFDRGHGVTYPSIFDQDGSIAAQWPPAAGPPYTFIIDRQGRIAARFLGGVTPDDLQAAVLKVTARRERRHVRHRRPAAAGRSGGSSRGAGVVRLRPACCRWWPGGLPVLRRGDWTGSELAETRSMGRRARRGGRGGRHPRAGSRHRWRSLVGSRVRAGLAALRPGFTVVFVAYGAAFGSLGHRAAPSRTRDRASAGCRDDPHGTGLHGRVLELMVANRQWKVRWMPARGLAGAPLLEGAVRHRVDPVRWVRRWQRSRASRSTAPPRAAAPRCLPRTASGWGCRSCSSRRDAGRPRRARGGAPAPPGR